MKVSVITVVYNNEKNILSCLESVSTQDFCDIEHVIQDGLSSDKTLDFIQEFTGLNVKLKSEKDNGIYDALNRAIRRCSGDVIAILHSDDLFAFDSVISKVIRQFKESGSDAVYGDLDYVAEQDVKRVVRKWRSGSYHPRKLYLGWMPPHPALFVKKDVYMKYGLFDANFQISGDYDAMLRWLYRYNINVSYLPEVLIKMRTGGTSNRSVKNIVTKMIEDYSTIRKNRVGGIATLMFKNFRKISQFF